ncbi:MAG: transcriptional regulator GcvA [Dongiaceae bacterium]
MKRRLPPLSSLRAFEAAARHLSFADAAEELAVTPAAVSHQVKRLEEYLGVKLFRRLNRQVLLTDAGQLALPDVRAAFDRLAMAMDRVARRRDDKILTVTSTTSFAGKWLVPRLDRFRKRHPEIEVRIDAADYLVDFERENIDMGIRYGKGGYPGLRQDRLFYGDIFPVCSPKLLEGPHALKRPADLKWHTLLHSDWDSKDDSEPDWRMWLRAAGVTDIDPTAGPKFFPETVTLQAAIEGHGVALGNTTLAGADLAAGRLVKPFEFVMPVDFGYFVIAPEKNAQLPKIVWFRDWLLEEAAALHREVAAA